MRDGWFSLVREYGRVQEEPVVVWSWDYDGASDVVRSLTPRTGLVPAHPKGWPRVDMYDLERETPNPAQLKEFWDTLAHASGPGEPAMVMSGSARIVYQVPGKFEQDGLNHVTMQNEGLRRRGFSVRVDRAALRLSYNYQNVKMSQFEDAARAKMDIVLQQIRHAQNHLRTKKILFVFVDDIYASVLADMFVSRPDLVPSHVTIHLVHYVSYRPRRTSLARTRAVTPGVLFSPY